MIDNLFIVESPLQALVAVELSLQFSGQSNGIIYKLAGDARKRNDEQLTKVIDLGDWSFREQVEFYGAFGVFRQLNSRKYILQLKKRFKGDVKNLFVGEFRSQWMHLARQVIAPNSTILMDDGAATLMAKRSFIDQGVFYPKQYFSSKNPIKRLVKSTIYWGIFDEEQSKKPMLLASAFLRGESDFDVSFSFVRERLKKFSPATIATPKKVYYFGSKYSEAGIISRDYELDFISHVLRHYRGKGLDLVYCAHRDESDGKLSLIRKVFSIEVLQPDLPAELFLLERDSNVAGIGAAYSTVINNLALMYPDKPITSFRLCSESIRPQNRAAIHGVYQHFVDNGITVVGV